MNHLAIKRSISHLVEQGKKLNSTVIKKECRLEVSTRTVRSLLSKMGMRYSNVKKTIFLTKIHKQKRVEMVKKWLTENHHWDRTIFSDLHMLLELSYVYIECIRCTNLIGFKFKLQYTAQRCLHII